MEVKGGNRYKALGHGQACNKHYISFGHHCHFWPSALPHASASPVFPIVLELPALTLTPQVGSSSAQSTLACRVACLQTPDLPLGFSSNVSSNKLFLICRPGGASCFSFPLRNPYLSYSQ